MESEEEVEAAVVKRGETCIITTLSRTALGMSIRVKAHAAVELFMRGLAEPDTPPAEVGVADRYWLPDPKAKTPLLAYRLTTSLQPVAGPMGGPLFTLDRLARPLLDLDDPDGPGTLGRREVPVNLSYLRLVGISEGMGVSFNIRGVYSLDTLRHLQERISTAQQQFYIHYIRPVNLSVITSTQEVQL